MPLAAALMAESPQTTPTFEKTVKPFLNKFCVKCHTGQTAMAGVDLSKTASESQALANRDLWQRAVRNIRTQHMPPAGSPQPAKAQRDSIVNYFDEIFNAQDCKLADPGRVTIRRLNKEEYNNSIRDLIGLDLKPADDFPSDDVGYGFSNIGDVLSISPLLMEKYLTAAEKIATTAIQLPQQTIFRYETDRLNVESGSGNSLPNGSKSLFTNGEISCLHKATRAGTFNISIRAYGQQAGPEVVRMALRIDNRQIQVFNVAAVQSQPAIYQFAVRLELGNHQIAAAFLNDYYQPNHPDPKQRDRNMVVDFIEVEGPLEQSPMLPLSHQKIIFENPVPATIIPVSKKIINAFASKAYRRPITEDEENRLLRIVQLALREGESFERGIQLMVQAVLVSPNFLFRIELDSKPNDPKTKHPINEYELASRLSYFIWASLPDDKLFELAASKQLSKPEVLKQQIARMLSDKRSRTLATNFASQWLNLPKLDIVAPDSKLFPKFNEELRKSMVQETVLFCQNIFEEDKSLIELLDGKYTYVNESLAKLYGIGGVYGQQFKKVPLGENRAGVLTHASVLTLTSNPTRTSPVKRGKWILEQILGTPPPPPPPGADNLDSSPSMIGKTMRERLESHRKNPACAQCHQRLDPLGFGLENFDAIGAWRENEGKIKVDATGILPNGTKFVGPAQLRSVLLSRKDEFIRNLSEKMLIYAIGRGTTAADECHIDEIAKKTKAGGYKFSALINAIVQSEPFRMRRGDGGGK